MGRFGRVALLLFCAKVEWFDLRARVPAPAGAGMEPGEEEFQFIMTITCPLCANVNECLAQPSSTSWKQVACCSCEANLVLVREASSKTPRRPLQSAIRLMPPSSETKQRTGIVGSRLVLIAAATAFALGVLGYLAVETELFSDHLTSLGSSTPPAASTLATSSGRSQPVSQPSLPIANESVTK